MGKENDYQISKNLKEKHLRELCTFFKNKNLQELTLTEGEMVITLKGIEEVPQTLPPPVISLPETTPVLEKPDETVPEEVLDGNPIPAPISGNFYSSPSPNDPPYVKVGDKIKKGDKVGIIEAMKVMNEIPSPFSGTVTAILAENGKPVKQGHTIITVK